ncbi:MAG TPA: hypothetical protein VH082_12315 [Rudaea sp.]|jgi:hypothetical protein|nr:hypothetical protein [Rudaea sp.]
MRILALQVAGSIVCATALAQPVNKGLRFDSAGVLDLAQPQSMAGAADVPVMPLDQPDASNIIAMTTPTQEKATLPFSDDAFGCKPPSTACSAKHEATLIGASDGVAKRSGSKLTVRSASFVDWKMPESKNADGDGETHWYLGSLKGSGYARVEVQFEHDSPGSFLINPANGRAVFVHNGSDVVAMSPDGAHMATLDVENAPMSLRIADLDAKGPTLSVQCEGKTDTSNTHLEFKGWHDANAIDLALVSHAARSRLARAIAVRLAKSASGWQLETADADSVTAAGFSCRQAKP